MDENLFADDSDYEEHSIISEKQDGFRSTNVISDSDEEDASSSRNSYVSSAQNSSSGSTAEDKLNISIKKAIRRSIHRFMNEDKDSDKEQETDIVDSSDDSDDDEVIANSDRRIRNVISDDTSEEELEERGTKKEQRNAASTKGLKNYGKNGVIEFESSDEKDLSSKEQSMYSIRESVSPEKKQIKRRPRDRTYEDLNEDESYEEDEYSSRDQSREEANSFEKGEDYVPPLPELNDSAPDITILDAPKKYNEIVNILNSSDEEENYAANASQTTMARSIAHEETLNTSTDPVIAQKQSLLIYKQQMIETQLAKAKMILATGNMASLPDHGQRLRQSITKDEKKLAIIVEELNQIQLQQSGLTTQKVEVLKHAPLFKQDSLEVNPAYLQPTMEDAAKELGKKAQETLQREQSLTAERLKDLHGSLLARPTEDEKAEDPRGLKVPLMPHQQHALAWLLWRERQKPAGGVLADDMGLGKTLSMISLVVACKAKSEAGEDSDDEADWHSSGRSQKHLGGTLVVAPASLLAQWEAEVKNRCKRGLLSIELYHGNNRESVPRRLAKNDIVVTTYNLLSREFKATGVLYKIRWRRVILDEGHVIRNHKSQTCEAVCGLHANKRWALTGTPIQNKEMDLYSILKFLQCSPFDDVRVWKRWVDNKNAAGHERLATVMKTLMLRRTKAELQAKGQLDSMPEKSIEVIEVNLDPEERLVYDKVMVYSRTLFAQFLSQRAEKHHMFELGAGKYDKPSWTTTYKDTQFTKAQNKLLSLHADVKSHEILVLLLRLRQVCCHPSLIHSMLDQEDIEGTALEDGGPDMDLLSKMTKMDIHGADEDGQDGDFGVDERVKEHLLTSENPVFNPKRQSSKMRAVLAKIEEILDKGDKIVVVSQWVGVLNVIADELRSVKGAKYRMFTGQVAVKDRQGIMDDFNSRNGKPNILLLSLTAGGVGLNLVGANHLLLIDIHWNPQLESQAQDRIYRFGQKKDVYIYKYICTDTIEERIQSLQENKLQLASAVLSGGGSVVGSKLSLDDIKSLFSI